MQRRSFFMLLGQTSLAAVLAAVVPAGREQAPVSRVQAPVPVQGRLLAGTPDGRILESLDGGLSWQPIANFGPHCAILRIFEDRDQIVARVGVAGHSFDLRSWDGRTWLTLAGPGRLRRHMPMSAAATTLRPVCPADAAFLLAVYAGTRAEELALVDWEPAQAAAFLQMQFEAQRQAYAGAFPTLQSRIIVRAGQDVGRLLLAELEDEFRVVDLALLPDYRGQGIGTALLTDIMAQAGRTSKAVRLHVEIWNPARQLYDRLGFKPVGEQGLYRLLEWQPALQPASGAPESGAAASASDRAWQHGAFLAQLNAGFRLRLADAGAVDLELVEVSPLRVTPRQEIFSLVFRGPVDRLLPQQIYALEHATLGTCSLFLVPIRQDPAGSYYEAVFNRLVGPA